MMGWGGLEFGGGESAAALSVFTIFSYALEKGDTIFIKQTKMSTEQKS